MTEPRNIVEKFFRTVYSMLEGPVVFVRENIVEPSHREYPWYHEKKRRVPTIDQCYTDDVVCYNEANWQFKRDRMIDSEILEILRKRFEACVQYETPDHLTKCKDHLKSYEDNSENWFIKYGDLGGYYNVRKAYMKQKHRMLWERKYGAVGQGAGTESGKKECKLQTKLREAQ